MNARVGFEGTEFKKINQKKYNKWNILFFFFLPVLLSRFLSFSLSFLWCVVQLLLVASCLQKSDIKNEEEKNIYTTPNNDTTRHRQHNTSTTASVC